MPGRSQFGAQRLACFGQRLDIGRVAVARLGQALDQGRHSGCPPHAQDRQIVLAQLGGELVETLLEQRQAVGRRSARAMEPETSIRSTTLMGGRSAIWIS